MLKLEMYKLELELVVMWDILSSQWPLPPYQGWRLIPSCLHPSCSYSLLMCVFPSLCTQILSPEMGKWWSYQGPCCLLARVGYTQRSKLYSLCTCACMLSLFSCVRLCATLWTVDHHIHPPMGFSRQEYWSVFPCPPPGDWTHISWISCVAGRFFIAEPLGKTILSVQFPIIVFLTLISLSLRCKPLCPSQPITAPSLYHNCPHLVVGHSYPHPVLLCDMEWLGPECSFTQLDLEHMPRWFWETWQPIEQTSLHLAFQAS